MAAGFAAWVLKVNRRRYLLLPCEDLHEETEAPKSESLRKSWRCTESRLAAEPGLLRLYDLAEAVGWGGGARAGSSCASSVGASVICGGMKLARGKGSNLGRNWGGGVGRNAAMVGIVISMIWVGGGRGMARIGIWTWSTFRITSYERMSERIRVLPHRIVAALPFSGPSDFYHRALAMSWWFQHWIV
jgi:hypothetical protein